MAGGWLIVGLGNPGPEYEWSPHNVGFLAVERLASRNSIRVNRPDSQSLVGVGSIAGNPVVLAKPQSYMNLSGGPVRLLVAKHEISLDRLLVVYDDLDLPWASLRVRPRGSAAGHNGMKSLVSSLGTVEFPRVRMGIHPGHKLASGKDFLLSPLNREQRNELDSLLDEASQAVETVVADGVDKAMAKFNRRAGGIEQEEA